MTVEFTDDDWNAAMYQIGKMTAMAENGDLTAEDIQEFGDFLSETKTRVPYTIELRREESNTTANSEI